MHAEAMLLVDDSEAEIAKHNAFLKQGMRADRKIDRAFFERRQGSGAFRRLVAAGQKRNAQSGGLGEWPHALEMLAREDFGRRHQRRLSSRLDHPGHREQRDDRLAGADIALQQPQHAFWRGEIGADFGERLGLGGGEREGQRGLDLVGQTPVARARTAGEIAHARAHHQQRQLIGEQFVIGEPGRRGADRVDVARVLRIVEGRQSGGE